MYFLIVFFQPYGVSQCGPYIKYTTTSTDGKTKYGGGKLEIHDNIWDILWHTFYGIITIKRTLTVRSVRELISCWRIQCKIRTSDSLHFPPFYFFSFCVCSIAPNWKIVNWQASLSCHTICFIVFCSRTAVSVSLLCPSVSLYCVWLGENAQLCWTACCWYSKINRIGKTQWALSLSQG